MTQDELDGELLCEAIFGELAEVKEKLEAGAKVDAEDDRHRQALYFAAWGGKLSMAEFLLEKGAAVGAADILGMRPLHMAAEYGRKEMVEFLVEKGADPRARNDDGKTPEDLAAGHPEIRDFLRGLVDPAFREEKRREAAAETISAHWKRLARHIPAPGPRM